MGFSLNDIVPWGRNLEEYRNFFGLTDLDLNRKILACADGPASFNAELTALGGSCVSVDPIYAFTMEQINDRIEETTQIIVEQLKKNADDYNWEYYSSTEELLQTRLRAMNVFLSDYNSGKNEGRYRDDHLPNLSSVKENFDLVLCSHFLFLYSGHLSYDFHREAIMQMLKKGRELRIFPVCTLDGTQSPYLLEIEVFLREQNISYRIEQVNYEFQKGANLQLRIFRN